MRPWDVNRDGTVESIQYIDQWGEVQYINDLEGLCDRAGCQCIGPVINCNQVQSLLYEPAIAAAYAEQCFHTCQCLAIPETANTTNTTNAATNLVDIGDGTTVILPETLRNTVNRLNPDGAVLGHGACLAGEASGWTFERLAGTACCSGYSFNALSAQEAFMIYGLPYVSDLIAGIVTIGLCLPESASPKSS